MVEENKRPNTEKKDVPEFNEFESELRAPTADDSKKVVVKNVSGKKRTKKIVANIDKI